MVPLDSSFWLQYLGYIYDHNSLCKCHIRKKKSGPILAWAWLHWIFQIVCTTPTWHYTSTLAKQMYIKMCRVPSAAQKWIKIIRKRMKLIENHVGKKGSKMTLAVMGFSFVVLLLCVFHALSLSLSSLRTTGPTLKIGRIFISVQTCA